jgi:hypothetical protein
MSNNAETTSALGNQPSAGANLMESFEDTRSVEEMQRVNFQVPRSKHIKLKILAARRGQSIKEFLTDYIDSFPDE